MTTQAIKLLTFMTEAVDGKYEATKPTDEQLAAVLPWLIDQTVTWAHREGHCDTVYSGLYHIATAGKKRWDGDLKFYNAAGYDCYGLDREGYNKDGFNRNGYNKDGYDRYGYNREGYDKDGYDEAGRNKEGFNKDGLNRYGKTREQVAAEMIADWTPEHLQLVAAKLAERQAAAEAKAAEEAAAAEAAATEAAEPISVNTEELVSAAAA